MADEQTELSGQYSIDDMIHAIRFEEASELQMTAIQMKDDSAEKPANLVTFVEHDGQPPLIAAEKVEAANLKAQREALEQAGKTFVTAATIYVEGTESLVLFYRG